VPQIFHPSANTLSKVSIFGGVFIATGLGWVLSVLYRSPYQTEAGVVLEQPVQFSHKHHVQGLGIDCRYCHVSVETSAFAGIPATETCMSCHSQIWTNAPELEPVRESYRSGVSIPWVRVHDLPDFVQFNHSIHVAKGVQCASCHGAVETMPLTYREHSLSMKWCLDCHREPDQFVRSGVHAEIKTDCSYCHY
jgi:hypothetical protein